MTALFSLFERVERTIIGLLLASMTGIVFVEVVLRYGFNHGVLWAEELVLTMASWFVLFGASWALRQGAHISVDALIKIFPNPVQRVLTGVAIIGCLIYCAIFLMGSWEYIKLMQLINVDMEDLPFKRWHALSILLVAFSLLSLNFLYIAWRVLSNQQSSFHMVDEASESMRLAEEAQGQNGEKNN